MASPASRRSRERRPFTISGEAGMPARSSSAGPCCWSRGARASRRAPVHPIRRDAKQTTAREYVFGVSSSTPSRYGARGVAGFDSASPVLPTMTTEMTAGSVALAFADVVWTEPSGSKNV